MKEKKVVIKLTIEIDSKDYVRGLANEMFDNLNEIGKVTLEDITLEDNADPANVAVEQAV